MRNFALIISAILLSAVCASAQNTAENTINGRAVEAADSTQGVGFATVTLLRDSTIVTAVAADGDGRFTIRTAQRGDMSLQITMIGYQTATRAISVAAGVTDAGDIAMEEGVTIDDVVVTVQKPLVTSDAEKLTYSVENDPDAASSTLEEIIRKVPQLSLDAEGNILLNGSSDYKVLLNGHNSSMFSGNNLKEIIKSMPASQIKRIEVVTNPSMKYEADGASGIINIVTDKKNDMNGYNGSVNVGMRFDAISAEFANATVAMQRGKFAAQVNGYFSNYEQPLSKGDINESERVNLTSEEFYRRIATSRHSYLGRHAGASLSASYQPDTLNLLTLEGSFWWGENHNNQHLTERMDDRTGGNVYEYRNAARSHYDYTGGSIGLNYEHTFGREGHLLTISDEVNVDKDDAPSWTSITPVAGRIPQSLHSSLSHDDDRSTDNTLQIDYVNPIDEHHSIEAGTKYIFRRTNTYGNYTPHDDEGTVIADEATRTDMRYDQSILGIYAGYTYTHEKFSVRAGGRLEQMWNDAEVDSSEQGRYGIHNTMLNFVPYASFTYKPKEGHTLSLTYTQRLQRPWIGMMSPYRDESDPMNISYGNPHLKAATFNRFSLKYGYYSNKWSTSWEMTGGFSNNYVTRYSFVDAAGVANTTYSNDVHQRGAALNGSVSYRPNEKVNISLSLRGVYDKYSLASQGIDNSKYSFSQNFNADFMLWKEARLSVGEGYSSGYAQLMSSSDGYYYYYLSIKQSLFKKKLEITLSAYNPFNKFSEYKSSSSTPTYVSRSIYRDRSRQFGFSLGWRFGKQNIQVKSTERSISNDDMMSSGKGGQGGN